MKKLKKRVSLPFCKFPTLHLVKSGIYFNSHQNHRIKYNNYYCWQFKNVLYVKTENSLVCVSNVKEIRIYNGYLYFSACGKVEINLDCSEIYRHFLIKITSHHFDLSTIKQQAILGLLNNGFNVRCDSVKRYIDIIENVLKISVSENGISIKQNRFKLAFTLIYKLNNKIRRINVNQTL